MTYLKMALRNLYRRRSRSMLTIIAIGLAVSMMVLLTSVGLGLKEQGIQTDSVDFWVVPSGSDVMDPVTDSPETMMGGVHSQINALFADPRILGATPVLNRIVYSSDHHNRTSVLLAVGVIPGLIDIMPASAGGFTHGDPYFYGGEWTSEAVINTQTANLMELDTGDLLYLNISISGLQTSRPFTIVNIIDTVDYSTVPVVVVHLSELQHITGDLENDRAHHILVQGPSAGPFLKELYPDHLVLSGTQRTTLQIISDKRILATAVAASVLAFVLGMLFIGTTMVMSISEREGEMAVMSAIGISRFSVLKIVFYESLILSITGGVMGIVMTLAGKILLNSLMLRIFGVSSTLNPLLLLGGLVVTLMAGIFTGTFAAILMKRPRISRAI